MDINNVTSEVIGSAIEVHKAVGPGLLESAYGECLCRGLELRNIAYERRKELPVEYKGTALNCGYRLDVVLAGNLIVEMNYPAVSSGVSNPKVSCNSIAASGVELTRIGLKTCDALPAIHQAQHLTYLKLTGMKVGLLINFNVPVLKDGIRRLANLMDAHVLGAPGLMSNRRLPIGQNENFLYS